jgi:flagellin-like protein
MIKRGKKGISAVVATVLIILITVAAVTMVWAFIIPMIKNSISTTNFDTDLSIVSSGGYTAFDNASSRLCVQVKRGADNSNVNAVQFNVVSKGNSYTQTVIPAPSTNQQKTYCFNASGIRSIESVRVAPVFTEGNTKKTGIVTGKMDNVPEGDLSTYSAIYYNLTGGISSEIICSPQCASPSSVTCGHTINSTNECNSSCSRGTYCSSGVCNSNGQCEVCTPQCASPSSVACGQAITPSNGCGTCDGTGTLCSAGQTCTASQCVVGTLISSFPYTISSSGTYFLSDDVLVGANGISITANNATLNCYGHNITGNSNNGAGISVSSKDRKSTRLNSSHEQ